MVCSGPLRSCAVMFDSSTVVQSLMLLSTCRPMMNSFKATSVEAYDREVMSPSITSSVGLSLRKMRRRSSISPGRSFSRSAE